MNEPRSSVRLSLPTAIIATLCGSALTFAVTWGATSERIKNLEVTVSELRTQNEELRRIVILNNVQVAELKVFTADATRRLDRIERKIDGAK